LDSNASRSILALTNFPPSRNLTVAMYESDTMRGSLKKRERMSKTIKMWSGWIQMLHDPFWH
jgi:hypothetical protein